MKGLLGLCLALMVFLSNDWVIQGSEGLQCMAGVKCNGLEGCKGVVLKTTACAVHDPKKCWTEHTENTKNGYSMSRHFCGEGGYKCPGSTSTDIKMTCQSCSTDNCNNSAPKSAQGLGIFMMTAALATVVILGM